MPDKPLGSDLEDRSLVTHAHHGHPKKHPVAMRHRKQSQDPLHGEEDKLVDEYKTVREQAMAGNATHNDVQRLLEIKGRLDEIQCTREGDSRHILGDTFKGNIGDKQQTTAITHKAMGSGRNPYEQKPVD